MPFASLAALAALLLMSQPALLHAEDASALNAARYQLAQKHTQTGQRAQAEAIARLIIADQPNWMFGWLLLGMVLANEDATLPQARKALERAARIDPNHVEPLKALGVLASKRGDTEQAIDYLLRASELAEDDANLQIGTARILLGAQRYEEAKQRYLLVLGNDPKNLYALAGLGHVHNEAGEYSQAIAVYQDAIAAGVSHPLLWVNLSDSLIRSGRFAEALDACIKGYEKHADNELRLAQVRALMGLERFKEAETLVKEMSAAPGYDTPHLVFFAYWLGMATSQQGCQLREYKSCSSTVPAPCCKLEAEALAAFQKAYELDPEFKDIVVRLGLAQATNGLLEDAEATLQNELRTRGDRAEAVLFGALAIALYLFDQPRDREEAVRLFREARELAPDFSKRERLAQFRQWPPLALDISDELRTLAAQTQLAQSSPRSGCACSLHHRPSPAPAALALGFAALLVLRLRRHRGARPVHAPTDPTR